MPDEPSFQARPCPICRRASERAYRPFCSRRCADIDLHRWLSGRYAVPADEQEAGPNEADGFADEDGRSAGQETR